MDREQFIARLREIEKENEGDEESSHGHFDDLLVEYINDEELTKIYNKMILWYA